MKSNVTPTGIFILKRADSLGMNIFDLSSKSKVSMFSLSNLIIKFDKLDIQDAELLSKARIYDTKYLMEMDANFRKSAGAFSHAKMKDLFYFDISKFDKYKIVSLIEALLDEIISHKSRRMVPMTHLMKLQLFWRSFIMLKEAHALQKENELNEYANDRCVYVEDNYSKLLSKYNIQIVRNMEGVQTGYGSERDLRDLINHFNNKIKDSNEY